MTTIEQLVKLSELAPDVCQKNEFEYLIGGYIFWLASDGEFSARIPNVYCHIVGQPALDWLQCALQRVIEARGMYWSCKCKNSRVVVEVRDDSWLSVTAENTLTDALLGALIKALEVEK